MRRPSSTRVCPAALTPRNTASNGHPNAANICNASGMLSMMPSNGRTPANARKIPDQNNAGTNSRTNFK